jgi:hypothetical protein
VVDEVILEQGVGVPVQLLDDHIHITLLSQALEDVMLEQGTGVPVHEPVLEL